MASPARRHFQRVSASLAAASAAPGETLAGSAYELMLAKLATDRRRLKSIMSIERKIEVKRVELLPEYVDYVAGALAGGRGAQDDVLTTVMIWRVDAGDYAGALDIARYAIAHRMTLPDQYDRPSQLRSPRNSPKRRSRPSSTARRQPSAARNSSKSRSSPNRPTCTIKCAQSCTKRLAMRPSATATGRALSNIFAERSNSTRAPA